MLAVGSRMLPFHREPRGSGVPAAGGHQLQLNAVNREKLIDAQKHPGKYPNLIVRVWGWSGYFDELDTPFQDHVIRRTEYTV